ncbi:MAG: polyisoprenoid-binding protein YceI [Nonlabens sp.]|jgi:polyisoprenoid-binding protein YceI
MRKVSSMVLRISLLLACLFISSLGAAQTGASEITFTIKNAGIGVDGFFEQTSVSFNFKPNDLGSSYFKLTIPTSTINTGINARDKHLRKSKYFDVENYPTLSYTSTNVVRTVEGFKLLGKLTIKETTLPIEIPFSIDVIDGIKYFNGAVELDRRDYGVGKNHLILGDLVNINIKVPYSEN